MNILFITMSNIREVHTPSIYSDLMRKFRDEGHKVTIVSPRERRSGLPTKLEHVDGVDILGVKTLNLQKTNVIEKGIGQVLVENQFSKAYKRFLSDQTFDLILYSTPPITFPKVIRFAKKRNPQAKTYLMLKDIFPQNAVDLGMLVDSPLKGSKGLKGSDGLKGSKGSKGLKGLLLSAPKYLLYRKFRKKEKTLYAISDFIGCMSPANVKYVIGHNSEVDPEKVEVCPNSYAVMEASPKSSPEGKDIVRQKYGLPVDKPIFIYGGNLGKPQGIPFLIKCLEAVAANKEVAERAHFLIVGDGTDYGLLEAWVKEKQPQYVSLFKRIPKEDYDRLADACDVGLIFLDYRFTIPNYPSRLLPYLMNKKPVLCVTDEHTDVGKIAADNRYGFSSPSNNASAFVACVDTFVKQPSIINEMGENGYRFYLNNYTVQHTYDAIMKHF